MSKNSVNSKLQPQPVRPSSMASRDEIMRAQRERTARTQGPYSLSQVVVKGVTGNLIVRKDDDDRTRTVMTNVTQSEWNRFRNCIAFGGDEQQAVKLAVGS